MPLGVVPDIVTIQSMTFLVYQYISTHTYMPVSDTLPHISHMLYMLIVETRNMVYDFVYTIASHL